MLRFISSKKCSSKWFIEKYFRGWLLAVCMVFFFSKEIVSTLSRMYCVKVEFCYLFVITVIVFVITLTALHLITEDTSFIISMVLFVLSCQCNKGRVQFWFHLKNGFNFLFWNLFRRKNVKQTMYLGGSWDWCEVWKEIGPPSRGFLTIVNDWKY